MNKLFLIFSIVVSIMLCSCEEKDGPSPMPEAWKIESVSGDVEVSEDDPSGRTVVYFGADGGSVRLKHCMHSYLTICPDTKTYPADAYGYNNSDKAVSFKNEWFEAKVDGRFLYIEIQPCDTESIKEISVGISDYALNSEPYVVSVCPRRLRGR